MKNRLFLINVVILFCNLFLPAQNPYIRHYTTFDGLPSNVINNVFQDSRKFIWFATDAGVVRFDGSKFITFTKKDGLNTSKIIRIKEDSFGRVWITNWDGSLNFFFHNKIYNSANAPFLDSLKPNDPFHDFFEDDDRTIYFYNAMYEIFALDRNNHVRKLDKVNEHFLEDLRYPDGLKVTGSFDRTVFKSRSDVFIFNLYKIRKNVKGEYLFWSALGVLKVKKPFENPVLADTSNDAFIRASCSRKGYFYILLHDKMILRYKDEIRVDTIKTPFSIMYTMSRINSLLVDNDELIWIGTFDEGVSCLSKDHVLQHFDIRQANTIIQDHENNIWISSATDGVYKINPHLNTHRHYENSLFQNKGIRELAPNPYGGLWLTNGTATYFLEKNILYPLEFSNKTFSCDVIYHLKSNKLILGEKYSYFYYFKDVKPDRRNKKIIYTATQRSRLFISGISINKKEDKINCFNYFNFDLLDPDTLFGWYKNSWYPKDYNVGSRIYYTYYDNDNDLIINAKKNYILGKDTFLYNNALSFIDNKIISQHLNLNDSTELFNIENEGVYLFHNKKFFALTSKTGNSSDLEIRNVSYDKPVLYLSSSGNIYTCNNPLDIIKNKPVDIQLVDINFRNIHKILTFDDSLYIASDDGLTVIPEALIKNIVPYKPIPYIQSILADDKEVDFSGKNLVLKGRINLKFIFGSINYSSTPVIYSYQLEGADHGWSSGTGNIVDYKNLPFEDYIFRLRICKPDSPWSETLSIKIKIQPRFWQHPAFIAFLLIMVMAIITLIIFRIASNKIKQRETDHQLILFEQKALQAMMNPHFIFNTLGSIQNYLLQNKSDEAGLYLSQFARLIRLNISSINSNMISLEEEVNRLRIYLDLEQFRMENRFEYRIEFGQNIEEDEVYIPSMLIQPFVENAIWHGISPLEEKGLIRISFSLHFSNALRIIIEDNGIGIKRSAKYSSKGEDHLHLTMDVIRKRLEILGKKMKAETSMDITEAFPDNLNPGTRVILIVPYSVNEKEN